MKKLILSIVFLITLGVFACSRNEVEVLNSSQKVSAKALEDYLVFGQVGLGWGCRASAIYMINEGKLYADTSNVFCKDQEQYQFSGFKLPDSEYEKVKTILNEYPTELSSLESRTFGCPGCADGGMLFLQRKEKGKAVKSWRIDDSIFYRETDVTNQPFPKYLSVFGQKLGTLYTSIKVK